MPAMTPPATSGLGVTEAFVGGDPRNLLAQADHVAQVRVHAGIGAGLAEGLLMQMRRAGPDDDAREALLLDVLFDQLLSERGAHELVVAGDGDAVQVVLRPMGEALDVDRAGDVAAAVADVDANALRHLRPPLAGAASAAPCRRACGAGWPTGPPASSYRSCSAPRRPRRLRYE